MKIRLFLLITLIFLFSSAEIASKAETTLDTDELIRLHIVANSDSDEDQAVKLEVRDAIRNQVKKIVDSAECADDAFAALEGGHRSLEKIAEEVLGRHGYTYGVRVTIGAYEFPDREYDGVLVPAGTYRAVKILLGAGDGQNWWCVLYPDLCFVDEACRKEAEDGKPIVFYSSIGRWINENLVGR